MDGWSLSRINDPGDPDLAAQIDLQLARIANGVPGYPCARPLPDDDVQLHVLYRVRIGDGHRTVVCDAPRLRDALEDMPVGMPVDLVWRELLICAAESL
jgi:hypothetical protein